ncbi:MAG: NAD(P)H-hydrate dehydratase [Gammaproteobacteria bacterium]|nr:NAD(P)H-hydrate dehydratase [Gammaproteobacteria bacterium]
MVGHATDLPRNLYSAEQVRELDRRAIEEHGIPGQALMERAGKVAFGVLCSRWPLARHITVLCGMGNNGGDGYVTARLAHQAGRDVCVIQVGDAGRLHGNARAAADAMISTGLTPSPYDHSKLATADVVVDALLGTGLDRQLSGEWEEVIHAVNERAKAVLSIDIPSGLNADTGCVMGSAVRADVTITFVGLKRGLFTGRGLECSGEVLYHDLEVPAEVYREVEPSALRLILASLQALLGRRPRAAHKGRFGHVLVVGGDEGFAGAARMAAEAAGRVGAGLISLATRSAHAGTVCAARPEIMSHGIEDPNELPALIEHATVVAVGPGLGQSPWAVSLFTKVLEQDRPMVLDADALNLLAADPVTRDHWILTPHPGEAARMLGCSTLEVEADRFKAATDLQRQYGGVVVLKGAGSVIAEANEPLGVCHQGNPGMASGGMGDVLTGCIAGLLAQGLNAGDAARLGVCVHAAAGDFAAKEGERGLLATDLMPWLRRLVNPGAS